jgi:hypothetical protein
LNGDLFKFLRRDARRERAHYGRGGWPNLKVWREDGGGMMDERGMRGWMKVVGDGRVRRDELERAQSLKGCMQEEH